MIGIKGQLMAQQQNNYKIRVNYQIRAAQVQLINSDGTNFGVIPLHEALKKAQELNIDLVEINPRTTPIIVKLMDYGKFKYEEKKKASEAKKNQKEQELKEITFRPNTDTNDLLHKLEQAKGFLNDGNRVKMTIRFRGREITHPEIGRDKLEWIFQQLTGLIQAAPSISMEGKFMQAVVSPIKK
jgi:translation initiation factor IF-3